MTASDRPLLRSSAAAPPPPPFCASASARWHPPAAPGLFAPRRAPRSPHAPPRPQARCGRCGGHLGDLFLDGFLWVGSAAFFSGKRYCIDGVRADPLPSKRTHFRARLLPHPEDVHSYTRALLVSHGRVSHLHRDHVLPPPPPPLHRLSSRAVPASQAALVFQPKDDPEERIYGEGCVKGKRCITERTRAAA